MAVQKLPQPIPTVIPKNKRTPPVADRSSLSHRLTNLSRQKLAREATAPDPDIRRCLGHFRLHVMSIEQSQKETTTKINSFDLESESESEDEDDKGPRGEHKKKTEKLNISTTMTNTPSSKDQQSVAVSVSTSSTTTTTTQQKPAIRVEVTELSDETPAQKDKEKESEGFLEKGRNCLEKTVQRKNFWSSSPGQCMSPVRIAG